jgi:glucose-fructose oxidoreductase
MIDACERARVKLMIAYRLHFEAATLAAVEPRARGSSATCGSSLGFCMQVKDGNIRLRARPAAARSTTSGSTASMRRAPCSATSPRGLRGLASREGAAVRGSRRDDLGDPPLPRPAPRLLHVQLRSLGRLVLPAGRLRREPAAWTPPTSSPKARDDDHRRTRSRVTEVSASATSSARAALLLRLCIQQTRTPSPGPRRARGRADHPRAVRVSRRGEPLTLRPLASDRRPYPSQRIDRPPVRQPGLVHAQPPSR